MLTTIQSTILLLCIWELLLLSVNAFTSSSAYRHHNIQMPSQKHLHTFFAFHRDQGRSIQSQQNLPPLAALSKYLENDLISVSINGENPRLYAVTSYGTISPLCTHEDDNPTDLYVDPRSEASIEIDDEDVIQCYGEGWYSQRVVPSLGGGPGYGAEADDIWIVEENVLDQLKNDEVELPNLDLGIAHGEKSRGGAI